MNLGDLNVEAKLQEALTALEGGDIELAKAVLSSLWNRRSQSRKLFERFIAEYPSEQGEWLARIQWGKLGVTEPMMRPIFEALARDKKSQRFRNGYVPDPGTWLARKPWISALVKEHARTATENDPEARTLRDKYLDRLKDDQV
jgi:hypothetical protein